jgi:hypothetical protein
MEREREGGRKGGRERGREGGREERESSESKRRRVANRSTPVTSFPRI